MPTLNTGNERRGLTHAFTLAEIMISLGVLTMFTLLLSQVINGTSNSMSSNRARLDADREARYVFDRISSDLAALPKEKGIDYLFSKQEGNDKLFFCSEVPGYFSSTETSSSQTRSPNSLLGYRVGGGTSGPILERVAKGLSWQNTTGGAPLIFLTSSGTSFEPLPASTLAGNSKWSSIIGTSPDYNGSDPNFVPLSEFVYRFEYCYLLKDGSYSNRPIISATGVLNNLTASRAPTTSDGGASGYAPGSRWYDTSAQRGYVCVSANPLSAVWSPIGMEDVSSVVVAIALLDPTSRRSTVDLDDAINAFPDPTDADLASNPPKLMASNWEAIRNQSSYASIAGFGNHTAGKVYIYQRYFNLFSQ